MKDAYYVGHVFNLMYTIREYEYHPFLLQLIHKVRSFYSHHANGIYGSFASLNRIFQQMQDNKIQILIHFKHFYLSGVLLSQITATANCFSQI